MMSKLDNASNSRKIICFLILLLWGFSAYSNDSDSFFSREAELRFQLEIPVSELKNQRGDDPEWLDGALTYIDAEGKDQRLEVTVKARGNFRRKRSSCSFPSYWVNLKKKQVKGTVLGGLDKLKIVSHCRETRKSFEPYIYKEYLAYKSFNILTEKSFKARITKISYIESKNGKSVGEFAGFVLEPVEDLADRLGGQVVSERYVLPSLYDPATLCRAELFQFMVGNTDFSFVASQDECCHNGKAVALPDGYAAIPYDFDMSGIVDTPYAVPNPGLKLRSVRDRKYRGIQVSKEVFDGVVREFISAKQDIISIWDETDMLPEKEKEEALAYIKEFYRILENPILLKTQIRSKMRNGSKMEEYIEERINELATP
ncbi:MAG: hypothetical protein AB3N63_12575 [Puniceicoccaceae bacterium]